MRWRGYETGEQAPQPIQVSLLEAVVVGRDAEQPAGCVGECHGRGDGGQKQQPERGRLDVAWEFAAPLPVAGAGEILSRRAGIGRCLAGVGEAAPDQQPQRARVAQSVMPQNSPVSFWWNAELGTIDIGGLAMGRSRKFRNLSANPNVAFVVDDIASYQPWKVRCVEMRGYAEALTGQPPLRPGMSNEIIRIHPTTVISFGLEDGHSNQ